MNSEVFITYSKSGVAYLKDTAVTTGLTWGMKPDSPYKLCFESILFSMGPVLSQPGKGTLVNTALGKLRQVWPQAHEFTMSYSARLGRVSQSNTCRVVLISKLWWSGYLGVRGWCTCHRTMFYTLLAVSPVSASTSACPWNSRRILPSPLPCHLRSAGITACATVPGSLWVLGQWNSGGEALTHWAILLGPKATYIVNIILKILKQNNECVDALAFLSSLGIPNLHVAISSLLLLEDDLLDWRCWGWRFRPTTLKDTQELRQNRQDFHSLAI